MVWLHRIALNPMANPSLPKNGRKVLSGDKGDATGQQELVLLLLLLSNNVQHVPTELPFCMPPLLVGNHAFFFLLLYFFLFFFD